MQAEDNPVLVTGLNGMIGSRFKELYGSTLTMEGMDLANGVDITDSQSVNRLIGQSAAKAVINLAAFTNVSAAHEQNGDKSGPCFQVNVTGTKNIAAACAKNHKHLIHISTDFVFDGTKETPYTEADEPQPIEWYGQTKLWAEEAVKQSEVKWVILRLAYPYQARPVRPDFVTGMREKMLSGTLPPQFTDHVVTPTWVDDVARVFDFCIKNQPKGIYHMTGSSWHTDYEMATLVSQIFGIEAEIKEGSLQAYLKTVQRPYQRMMKVSNAKLVRDFGIKMKTFEEGLLEIKAQLGGNGMGS